MTSERALPKHLSERFVKQAAAGVVRNPVPLTSELMERVAGLAERLDGTHHLQGVYSAAPEPTLVFQLPARLPERFDPDAGPRVVLWGWPGHFGASVTVTVRFSPTSVPARVFVPHTSPFLEAIRRGKFKALFCRGRRPICAYELDFDSSEVTREYLHAHVDAVGSHVPTIVNDEGAHYWEVLDFQPTFRDILTVSDRLSIGWYRFYQKAFGVDVRWMKDLRERLHDAPASLSVQRFPKALDSLFRVMFESRFEPDAMHTYMNQTYSESGEELLDVMGDWLAVKGRDAQGKCAEGNGLRRQDWDELFALASAWMQLYQRGSRMTACGKYLPWYDYRKHRFQRLKIEPKSFPAQCPPEQFWPNLQRGFLYAYGDMLDGSDFPVAPEALADGAQSFPQAENVEDVLNSAYNLLDEAVTNKLGTIPPKALVEISLGPFECIELSEGPDVVHVVFRTAGGAFALGSVNMAEKEHIVPIPGESYGLSAELRQRIDAGVFLLLSAIIRDFWVVETRESVFAHRVESQRRPGAPTDAEKPRVVYLPRVKYVAQPNIERCNSELSHHERRAHWVRAHLRRVEQPSEYQLILATRYGLQVPTGYTFVRPHERGKKKRDVIYRSKSALQCLYTVVAESGPRTPAHWFRFERDVHDLMKALGFEVEHVSVSRSGDNGVDVYARKGVDLEEVNWIIQCKCWRQKKKVSPAHVRELLGALQNYPAGTRGMIVTTSDFTSGAVEFAREVGIRTMNGTEFLQLVQKVRAN